MYASPIDEFLSRLEGVKPLGKGRWKARCPAHPDRSPSLTVADKEGTVLVHCWAGCSAADVIAAVGFQFKDLFPPDDSRSGPKTKVKRLWGVIKYLKEHFVYDAFILILAGEMMLKRVPLSEHELNQVSLATGRILVAAREVLK